MAIIGMIIYHNMGDGCISGKYQENNLNQNVEALKRINDPMLGDEFVGQYNSVWTEKKSSEKATLTIKKDTSHNAYILKWHKKGTVEYWGHGMLNANGELVVCYWDEDTEKGLNVISGKYNALQ